MPWQKGQSGNPAGRAPKDRVLTGILEAAGAKTLPVGDYRISRKRLAAEHVWNIVTTGKAVMPDGSVIRPYAKDWLETVRWLYGHIDGPPKAEAAMEHTGGITVHVTYDDVDLDPSPPAPGATGGDA